ncbi:MAG: ACP phosphodiesterase [Flavobacteriales bacterium]
MNFLGHLLVSGEDPLVITGNFMADGVKGRDLSAYPEALQRGIRMHRTIDSFTDTHPLTLQGRERLRAHCGKYAGVALDVFYDHGIARCWPRYGTGPLEAFTHRMYAVLTAHAHLMPLPQQRMLPYMVQGDWLTSYATLEGIGRALSGLARRVPHGAALEGAETVLATHLHAYLAETEAFVLALREHLCHGEG